MSQLAGTLFQGDIAVPAEAAIGKAKAELSFTAWREWGVLPAVAEVVVSDMDARPKIFQQR